jgi:ketol-acid reductoisomerase
VIALMRAGYETLVEAGYSPEAAYFETIHEVKLIVDLVYEQGIAKMGSSISNTAEYGGLTRGPRVVDASVKERMKQVLAEIQSGEFAREFIRENETGGASFKALRKQREEHPMEDVGTRLRSLLPWLAEERLADRKKNGP